MDQLTFPNVIRDADNQEAKRRFLERLESDNIELVFPRDNIDESFAFLKFFTGNNPQHSFMAFETSRDGEHMWHLVKVDVPQAGMDVGRNQEIEEYARTLTINVGKFRHPLEKFFVFNRGEIYGARNIARDPLDVRFDGFGFLEL